MWSLKMKAQSLNSTATLTISNIFYSNICIFIWTLWDLVNLTERKINYFNSSITFRYLFKSIYLNRIYNIIITKSNIWKYKMSLNLCIRIFRMHEYLWAICPHCTICIRRISHKPIRQLSISDRISHICQTQKPNYTFKWN